jgi:hypothetical protein
MGILGMGLALEVPQHPRYVDPMILGGNRFEPLQTALTLAEHFANSLWPEEALPFALHVG